MIVVGGVVPPDDFATFRESGAANVFGPGTVIASTADDLLRGWLNVLVLGVRQKNLD